jgi:pyruvate-formate lyase
VVERVGGYSAYFVNLPKAMQEEIIVGTEHGSP